MTDALQRLLEVQDQDTIGDQLRHRREAHPLRAELDAVKRERAGLESRLGEEKVRLDALAGRQAELEADVAAGTERIGTIEKRMYSSQGGAARDLQAMAEEVDSLRRRSRRLEDVILEVMEEREPVDALVSGLEEELAALVSRQGGLEAGLAAAEEELAAEEAAHAEQRRTLAATVPADLLERYERLRIRLGGIGVARLVGGSCGGCHLALPATELDGIRRAAPDAVVICEQCGRILVRGS